MNLKYVLSIFTQCVSISCFAGTTIDTESPYAYGANTGWINTYADGVNGAVLGQSYCSGHFYGANVGWIHLGNGIPNNGITYANDSVTDYGINHDGKGLLSGYAYGANIGWINFEQTYGKPKVNLLTGELSGYAYGSNIGWINLEGLITLSLSADDSDLDGISDAWEYGHTNTLTILSDGLVDADGDGVSDLHEYAADTDPFDPTDYLAITDLKIMDSTNIVTWTASPTRLYALQYASELSTGTSWIQTSTPQVPASGPEMTEEVRGVNATNRFYRIKVEPPLS